VVVVRLKGLGSGIRELRGICLRLARQPTHFPAVIAHGGVGGDDGDGRTQGGRRTEGVEEVGRRR
jgi:hypothetical protein